MGDLDGNRPCEAAFAASTRALTVLDRDRRIIKFNAEAARLASERWNVVYEEGLLLDEVGFADSHVEAFRALLDLAFGGERQVVEWSGEDILGVARHYELSFLPLRGPGGEVESALIVGEDVTSARQFEHDRRVHSAQVADSKRVDALEVMAAGVAHDFNNMLMIIATHASMIELEVEHTREDAPDLAGCVAEELEAIERTIARAKSMTTRLLEFAGRQIVEPSSISPAHALTECAESTRGSMPPGVEVDMEPAEGTWRVVIDPSQLAQILVSLVSNARDACAGQGRIALRVREELVEVDRVINGCVLRLGEYVVFEVEDDGCGIDALDLPRIFDPFFTTRSRGSRAGLGLASCFGITRGAGGAIDCVSELGEGATFRVWLPREQAPAPMCQARPAWSRAGGRRRLLLAEDQDDLRNALERLLVRYGYEVVACADGEEVIERLKKDRDFALLLTDVVMPNLGGVAAARAFCDALPGAPVVYMSGYVGDMLASHDLALGVTLVQKPCSSHELIEVLEAALDGVRGST